MIKRLFSRFYSFYLHRLDEDELISRYYTSAALGIILNYWALSGIILLNLWINLTISKYAFAAIFVIAWQLISWAIYHYYSNVKPSKYIPIKNMWIKYVVIFILSMIVFIFMSYNLVKII